MVHVHNSRESACLASALKGGAALVCMLDIQMSDVLHALRMQALAAEVRAAGGIMTAQDLAQAQPSIKQPVTTKVHKPCLAHSASMLTARAASHACTVMKANVQICCLACDTFPIALLTL